MCTSYTMPFWKPMGIEIGALYTTGVKSTACEMRTGSLRQPKGGRGGGRGEVDLGSAEAARACEKTRAGTDTGQRTVREGACGARPIYAGFAAGGCLKKCGCCSGCAPTLRSQPEDDAAYSKCENAGPSSSELPKSDAERRTQESERPTGDVKKCGLLQNHEVDALQQTKTNELYSKCEKNVGQACGGRRRTIPEKAVARRRETRKRRRASGQKRYKQSEAGQASQGY